MKKSIFCWSSLILLLLHPVFPFAQHIYLSPSGADSSVGTVDKPVASLATALERARSLRDHGAKDIQIIVREGEYFLDQTIKLGYKDSGSGANPLVIRSSGNGKPVFYGGFKSKSFKKIDGGLWSLDLSQFPESNFDQVYINKKMAIRAISPNSGFYNPIKVSEVLQSTEFNKNGKRQAILSFKVPTSLYHSLKNLNENEIRQTILTIYHRWDVTRKYLKSFNPEDSTISISGNQMKAWNKISEKSLFTLENVRFALDEPGEWLIEKQRLLYFPRIGEKIESSYAIFPVLEHIINIAGNAKSNQYVSNIVFKGLAFSVTGYKMPDTGQEPSQGAPLSSSAITIDYAKNIRMQNCEILQTAASGLWFRKGSSECKVEQCLFEGLGASAVKIGINSKSVASKDITNKVVLDNNIIRSGGLIFPSAVGVGIFKASDNVISHNDISDFRYTGISVGWVWGYDESPTKANIVEYNHVHHLGWGTLSDMGGIYTLGKSNGTIIRNNLVHDVFTYTYGGWGIYADEGSSNLLIEKNLVYRCKTAGFHQNYGRDNVVTNNIFAMNGEYQVQASRIERHNSLIFKRNLLYSEGALLEGGNWGKIRMISDSNLYWNGENSKNSLKLSSGQRRVESSSVVKNPLFANPQNSNFEFGESQAINQIGFETFDLTKIGVYGSPGWKQQASFPTYLKEKFDLRAEQVRLEAAKKGK